MTPPDPGDRHVGHERLVALGEADGTLLTERRWSAGYRHGEELLTRIDEMLTTTGVPGRARRRDRRGDRPRRLHRFARGLATAKALATDWHPHCRRPDVRGASPGGKPGRGFEGTQAVLLLPAGPSDRVVVAGGLASLLRGGEEPELEPRHDARGRRSARPGAGPRRWRSAQAEAGLAAALLRLGVARLAPAATTSPAWCPSTFRCRAACRR
jgi:hypothetical protein